ncbi:hypothetical protein SDC9_187909 [bioreactor metagenome]|uniref:Uncharacterized protein n=1 Tax=bioreactor metagenome TaxID=1076179 RepID=A0A645HYJ6_9ZZZZ
MNPRVQVPDESGRTCAGDLSPPNNPTPKAGEFGKLGALVRVLTAAPAGNSV